MCGECEMAEVAAVISSAESWGGGVCSCRHGGAGGTERAAKTKTSESSIITAIEPLLILSTRAGSVWEPIAVLERARVQQRDRDSRVLQLHPRVGEAADHEHRTGEGEEFPSASVFLDHSEAKRVWIVLFGGNIREEVAFSQRASSVFRFSIGD